MSLSAQLFGRDSFIFKATNALGLGIPGWLDKKFGPKDTEGPRLEDLSVQTSTYGADIPRLYGTISMAGNILWLEGGKLKEVVKKNKKGGKGGASTTPTKTYTYFATFALGLCEGPIAGVRRIWCSDTLLYNAGSDDLDTIIESNKASLGWKLYRGSEDQQPDPRYEADVGPGNAPAFRGLAYLVFYDFDLTDYANTLQASQFKFEVVMASNNAGVRQRASVSNSVTYNYPYITEADGECYVSSGISLYRHNSNGVATFAGSTAQEPQSEGTAIKQYLGQVSGGTAYVKNTGNPYINGTDVGIQKDLQEKTIALSGYVNDLASMKITGATISEDGLSFGILLSDLEFNSLGRLFVLFALDGTVLGEFEIANTDYRPRVGFGRRNHYNGTYSASCISNDRKYLITAYGAGTHDFCVYSLSEGLVNRVYIQENAFGESFRSLSIAENNGIVYAVNDSGSYFSWVLSSLVSPSKVDIFEVIDAEVSGCGSLTTQDISVAIDSQVAGYKVASGTVRSALEPLQSAYLFDVVQAGYKIRFQERRSASTITIPMIELYAGQDGSDDALSQSREMDSQLPNRVVVKYLDARREYDVSQQQYQRASTNSLDETSLDLSMVLGSDEAAQIAEKLCYLAWLERSEYSFTLPPEYLAVEPADVLTLVSADVSYELRVTETTAGIEGRVECKAVPSNTAIYSSSAVGGTGVTSDGVIARPGKSEVELLDIPVVDDTIQDSPGFVAAMAGLSGSWPGGVLIRSTDGGQTYANLQGFSGSGTFGTTIGALPQHPGDVIDQRSITVILVAGKLESVTRDQMLSGINYAAYGADQRWEIVRFQSAEVQVDGSYLVSGFVRGQRGTEWATGLHKEGDSFVLLDDPDNAFIDASAESLGVDRLYKAVTSRASAEDSAEEAFTYRGVNLKPLSPVYAKGARSSGSVTVSWTRRSRLTSSWWTTGVVAAIGETTESYEVDVISGSSVVRTLTASSPLITYTAAQQQSDFGAVQSAITLRIYQISSVVGRGYPLEVTL